MKLSQFNFPITAEQIAKYPARFRDESRMLVLHKDTGEIEHKQFKDIINYMSEGDTFVFNDTKVIPARLYGNKEKTGAEIEVFLLRELNKEQRLWDVLVDPARKIRIGNKLYFGEDDSLVAEVIDNTTSRGRTLRFLYDGSYEEFKSTLFGVGDIPIPKWIRVKPEEIDHERFHTIYAKNEGAVSTPAAGLHFSRELFKRMEIRDVNCAYLTLHMGLGHFRTVDVEDLSKHKMDSEQMIISEQTADMINATKAAGKKVFAVGITVVRALETPVTTKDEVKPYNGWTNKFIFPPYKFSIPDALITNFHMPLSTMLMSVAAFGGFDNVMNAYKVALEEGYSFGTYGDAMLII
ncbi:MAG: tRNA preQ1(34) S-adenosylmethionine ribosyltransferase-isomerase QueA [Bacteroidales bacterium]|jgi:S-adenosylmethionine:tRNA ribosyltransferase-isomerase|nr:tRNA preQ1(34) S-adenosylmethionine ribosyltransferase-isomerase QueA [Bacteroidales bacterium]MBQ1218854.1 tRNA preQ1(34) S-adenosylmethionine ribosyltransferase-isomerase QueA [Bacteroidales bacterium]MBQ1930351.1 tRNA preQ1(34) S-adenosylmethionine ribosyltransferase-isomerase QueA [Bacteroidales bacterium]MBR6540684.1 tRNA preQ1(34) S-adenosylmethionine ribosyltransferase-isomerase QueA [Bacteroidales bacterium]